MKGIKKEVLKLIHIHKEELNHVSKLFGGVYIVPEDDSVIVFGADNLDLKVIFRTTHRYIELRYLLDAAVEVQNLLESEGINVISKHDFLLSLQKRQQGQD